MANVQVLCALIVFAAASCAAQERAATADPKPAGKPGASVSFTHTLRAPVEPGGGGVLELTIDEGYDAGAMEITATSDGLDLAATSRSMTASMNGASRHQWDVYFDAPAGGVFYIDFAATVEAVEGAAAMRSYSASVQVGDGGALAKPNTAATLDAEGDPVVIMEAEETTED